MSAEQVRARAQAWLSGPALTGLVRGLDGPGDLPSDVDALEEWSARELDTRAGAERRDARPVAWSSRKVAVLLEAAEGLGLLGGQPPTRDAFDMTVVLGGATTGNRLRTKLALRLARAGVELGVVAALAAERSISAREIESEPDSADDVTEWVNLRRHVQAAFGPLAVCAAEHGGRATRSWRHERAAGRDGRETLLLVAPSADANRRANTADALTFLIDQTPLTHRRRVLVVTSGIYVPYHFLTVAPPLLAASTDHVELVGTPTSRERPSLLAQQIAQETHAAIQAGAKLLGRSR